jgi:hypothetical protein
VDSWASVQLPGEGYDSVCEDGFQWCLWVEFGEHLLAVQVEFGWVVAGD